MNVPLKNNSRINNRNGSIRGNKKRYLRPLKLKKRSKEFFVFDVETGIVNADGSIDYFLSARPEHFIFGCVYGVINGVVYTKTIYTVEDFKKEFLKRRYRSKIIYAHNAEYDLSTIYGNIYHEDGGAMFNGKFISMTNGVGKFADSFNILPAKLEKIGELLGLRKMQLGDSGLHSHLNKLDADIAYCIRDCKIVHVGLSKMFSDLEPSYTIGSMSLKVFRKNFLMKTIKINHHADSFFDCLYGGRTEAFKLGKTKAFVYDINSSYPWEMYNNKFPNPGTLREIHSPLLKDILSFEGMVYATVKINQNVYLPPLPLRYENMLVFPVGTFSGAWTIPEFLYSLQNGIEIYTIHSAIISEPIESPFKDFIWTNYTKRKASTNEFEKLYLKLYMNNLFGKMVQRTQEDYKFFDNEKDAVKFLKTTAEGGEIQKVNGGYFAKTVFDKKFAHTIACFGAYITAYGRISLHKFMCKNENDLVYCDTDSVFLEKELLVPSSAELGEWKKENKIVTNIRALKDYVYVDEGKTMRMLKGIKKNAVQMNEDANVFKFKRMIKTKESMIRVDNLPPGTFIDQIKFLTGDYLKREILSDGRNTKPFIL